MEDWKPVSEVDHIHPEPPPLPEEQKPSSPPPISEEKQDRPTGRSDSGLGTDEPFSPSTEDDTAPVKNRTRTQPDASNFTKSKSTSEVSYAGFVSRLVAYAVDLVLTGVASGSLAALGAADPTADIDSLSRGIGLLLTWFYFAGFESSKWQATPGKQLLGLKVTNLNQGRVGFLKATGRHFGKIISGLIFLMGFIMAAFTEKKQALHDMMAGTLVVKDT